MTSNEIMITVLWPYDIKDPTGSAYGWRNDRLIVVTGVAQELSLSDFSACLETYNQSLRPELLGMIRKGEGYDRPSLHRENDGDGKTYHYIDYHRPAPYSLRFYSLSGLELDLHKALRAPKQTVDVHPALHGSVSTRRISAINDTVILQMNSARELEALINTPLPAPTVAGSMTSANFVWPKMIIVVWGVLRVVVSLTLYVSDIRIRALFSTTALKDLSATVQQIDVRAEQAVFFPRQIRHLKRGTQAQHIHASRYINFYNTLWLILNDVILGVAVGNFLRENADLLADTFVIIIQPFLTTAIHDSLAWLDNWPAGLKLNTELSSTYAYTLVGIVQIWQQLLSHVRPQLPTLIRIVGYSGVLGLTTILSLTSDALSLVTLHLYGAYLACAFIFSRLLRTAGSLWNLFRGKRYNVLRNRVDNWDYELDQLLFGTILFTLLAFLFPTIWVYYALFGLTRLAVIMIHAVIETVQAFFNHFPLFALMLRVKDPWRLPGGIVFVPRRMPQVPTKQSDDPESAGVRLVLQNQPISFSAIFFQYLHLWSKLSAHYSPLRLLRCLATGQYITPIPRYSIRYSMLDAGGAS